MTHLWKSFSLSLSAFLFAASLVCWAQSGATDARNPTSDATAESFRIAPEDEVEITVLGASDLSIHGRVDPDGNIFIPLVGSVHVAGMTSGQAGQAIAEKLKQTGVMTHPQVAVFVKEFSQGEISVVGEVNKPGVYSALGPHRLLDMLQTAGGLTEKAGNTVVVSHRGTSDVTTVELPKDPVALAHNNIELQPGDTVIVPKGGIVYVLGEVNRPGGYVTNTDAQYTVLQVMAAAGGPTHLASESKTTILRRGPDGMQEIPVPLSKMLQGKKADITVQAEDILFVPSSRMKEVLNMGSIITLSSQAAIYRIP